MITVFNQEVRVVSNVSSSAVREIVLDEKGHIRKLTADEWLCFPWDEIRLFMHEYPVYVLPTTELLDALGELIEGYRTIEIGAGSGSVGRLLGIKMTDSCVQRDNKEVRSYYELARQPVIKYPLDVIKADALTAYRRFKPECILGCYVTHLFRKGMIDGSVYGVDFERLLPLVKRLILVGNKRTHQSNPIMALRHREIDLGGKLLTRSADSTLNRIFVWDN